MKSKKTKYGILVLVLIVTGSLGCFFLTKGATLEYSARKVAEYMIDQGVASGPVNKSDSFKPDGGKDAAEIPSLCTTIVEFPSGHPILKMIEEEGRIGEQHIYSYNNNLFVHRTYGSYSPVCTIYWDTWSEKPTQRLQEALRVFESYKGG